MALGTAIETATRWALPASPLFLAVLMLLAHAPYATPIVAPSAFYLSCMLGAVAGLVTMAVKRRWGAKTSHVFCLTGGIVLEASWLTLLLAEKSSSAPFLLAGSALAGLSTAWLLVLWLWAGQTSSLTCEVLKLAEAFGIAYVLYTLFSVIPHAGVVSYLFPALTCIPLLAILRRENQTSPDEPCRTDIAPCPRPPLARSVAVGLLIATFGAGFAALGFGGEHVEQGAGLLAILLVLCPIVFGESADLLRVTSVPLVVFSLCYGALAGSGNAFAFFLAGCGELVIWLFLQHRFGWGVPRAATPYDIAVRLLFIAISAGLGMAVGSTAFEAFDADTVERTLVLVVAICVADCIWRAVCVPRTPANGPAPEPSAPENPACDPAAPGSARPEASLLEKRFGLSPREAQVAALLCQNCSVSAISHELGMADSTTKTHVRHVYEKTGVHSREELQLLVASQS